MSPSTGQNTATASSCKSKKRKQTNELDTAMASVEELLSKPRGEVDEVGLFGRRVAAKMRTFYRKRLRWLEGRVNFFNIEYGAETPPSSAGNSGLKPLVPRQPQLQHGRSGSDSYEHVVTFIILPCNHIL